MLNVLFGKYRLKSQWYTITNVLNGWNLEDWPNQVLSNVLYNFSTLPFSLSLYSRFSWTLAFIVKIFAWHVSPFSYCHTPIVHTANSLLWCKCLCPLPPSSYVEILMSNVIVLGGGPFEKWLGHENWVLINENL